jgi:L-2-hydroxyglutarate oxidase
MPTSAGGPKGGIHTDIAVIGAGAIGASTAVHLAHLGLKTLILEQESHPALHQSGRNSGVIHPGHNLKPGTLKARLCVEGSRRLRDYCHDRHIPIREGGILVVARSETECATLAELSRRASANGVQARLVGEREMRTLEPEARGLQALHAPEGASFDARGFVESLIRDAVGQGAAALFNTRVLAVDDPSGRGDSGSPVRIHTSSGVVTAEAVVNCAGLQADRLAADLSTDFRIVPFRGYYAELTPASRHLVASHVYPAPDLRFPFLGVHFSRRVDGRVILGPGAVLAFAREAYRRGQVRFRDVLDTLAWPGFYRLLHRPGVMRLMWGEVLKSMSLRRIWAEARLLIPALKPHDLTWAFAGNRAQLVSRSGELVEDILLRETSRTIHVLNAVSPGLTCSLPFGQMLAERGHHKLNGSPASGV